MNIGLLFRRLRYLCSCKVASDIRCTRQEYVHTLVVFHPLASMIIFIWQDQIKTMRMKELSNGRLAMLAFSGMIHHNLVVKGPLFPLFPDNWEGPQADRTPRK